MGKHNAIGNFRKLVNSYSKRISCPRCHAAMLPIHYEKHCGDQHGMHPKTECVWCDGRKTWPSGKKYEHVHHLKQCFLNFVNPPRSVVQPVPERPTPSTFKRFNMRLLCPENDLFGRSKIPCLPPEAYAPVWTLHLDPPRLTFRHENLNLAVASVHKYLDSFSETEWFHVMIRATAFRSFLREMDADGGKSRTLPFSCWCDGGAYTNPKYKHHRHMIVIAPVGHFLNNVWRKVDTVDKPRRDYKCLIHKKITSPLQLVNTIRYVSQRKSSCKFSFERTETDDGQHHFLIAKGLPVDCKYVLTALWDGGISERIGEIFRNIELTKLALADVLFDQEKQTWVIRNGDIPDMTLNLVLPVSGIFVPTPDPTQYFVCLGGGRKLYFDPLNRPLPEEEWYERQMAGGNTFYYALADEWWTPAQHLQKKLNAIDMVLESKGLQIAPLRTEMVELKTENAVLRTESAKLKTENEELRTEMSDMRTVAEKLTTLTEKLTTLTEKLTTEITEKLTTDITEKLTAEIAELRTEISKLKMENDAFSQTRIKRLRETDPSKTETCPSQTSIVVHNHPPAENSEFKRICMENAHLKTRIHHLKRKYEHVEDDP